jgi:predicted DNA-binding protein YlxM (UPF0122 family)
MSKTDDTLREIAEKLEILQESIEVRFATMTDSLDTLARGLSLMSDTQGIQSDMLSEVLEACSADPGTNHELSAALDRVAEAMEAQNGTLTEIGEHLSNIGGVIEISVVRGIARVEAQSRARSSGLVDEDGVLIDDDEGSLQ